MHTCGLLFAYVCWFVILLICFKCICNADSPTFVEICFADFYPINSYVFFSTPCLVSAMPLQSLIVQMPACMTLCYPHLAQLHDSWSITSRILAELAYCFGIKIVCRTLFDNEATRIKFTQAKKLFLGLNKENIWSFNKMYRATRAQTSCP